MQHRHADGVREVHLAADVGRGDSVRLVLRQCRGLAVPQRPCNLRLKQGIRTGGPAAQVGIPDRDQLIARVGEQPLHQAGDLLPVLQRARRVPGDAVDVRALVEGEVGQQLRHVGHLRGELVRGSTVGRVVAQDVAVVLERDATTRRRRDDAGRILPVHCVQVVAHGGAAVVDVPEVQCEGAAAVFAGVGAHGQAAGGQQRGEVRVGLRGHHALDAALEHEDLSRAAGRTLRGWPGDQAAQPLRGEGTERRSEPEPAAQPRRRGDHTLEPAAHEALDP